MSEINNPLNPPRTGFRFLDWVERVGNKLPDPVTLFFLGAMLVLIGSAVAAGLGWEMTHPSTGEAVKGLAVASRSLPFRVAENSLQTAMAGGGHGLG
jgi:p-aminobenzoyl-glutamate transporter AbgT